MVSSVDGDTDFFDIVIGKLQGDTLESYLFPIDRSNKRKWLFAKKKKKKQEADEIRKL